MVAVHPNGQKAYIAYTVGADFFVGVLDLTQGTIKPIPLSVVFDYGTGWIGDINVAPSGAKAYVSWGVSGYISSIDAVYDQFLTNIYSPPSYHDEVTFSADSTLAFATSRGLEF